MTIKGRMLVKEINQLLKYEKEEYLEHYDDELRLLRSKMNDNGIYNRYISDIETMSTNYAATRFSKVRKILGYVKKEVVAREEMLYALKKEREYTEKKQKEVDELFITFDEEYDNHTERYLEEQIAANGSFDCTKL